MRSLVAGALAALLCFAAAAARADDKQACSDAYEKAQELRADGELRRAYEQLLICSQPACPDFVNSDCTKWMSDVSGALPSIVVAVRDHDGRDLTDVRVEMDGALLVEKLDGNGIPVDPGPHKLHVSAPGILPADRDVLVSQGEKNRVVQIVVDAAPVPVAAAPPAPKPEPASGGGVDRKTLGYLLGGLGVVGLGSFTFFAVQGKSSEHTLEKTCKPNCSGDQVSSVRSKYVVADISLGVGLAALGVGAWLVFFDDSAAPQPEKSARLAVGVRAVAQGAGAFVGGSF